MVPDQRRTKMLAEIVLPLGVPRIDGIGRSLLRIRHHRHIYRSQARFSGTPILGAAGLGA